MRKFWPIISFLFLPGLLQAQAYIFRSVQPAATDTLSRSSVSNTLTISKDDGVAYAVFSSAQPDTIGVGDCIVYKANSKTAFITARASATRYRITDSLGVVTAVLATSAETDWEIYRAYTGMADIDGAAENTSIPSGIRNFDGSGDLNLSTLVQWRYYAFYRGVETITSPILIDGWTTNNARNMVFYTPYRTSEVGTSQRHTGKYTTSGYILRANFASANHMLQFNDATGSPVTLSAWVEGLIFDASSDAECKAAIHCLDMSGQIRIVSNVFKGTNNTSTQTEHAALYQTTTLSAGCNFYIYNNIAYDWVSTASADSLEGAFILRKSTTGGGNAFLFNNTAYNCTRGYKATTSLGGRYVVNNIAQACTDGFENVGIWSSGSTNNCSDIASDAPGTSPQTGTVTFVDAANDDYHLSSSDTKAKNLGVLIDGIITASTAVGQYLLDDDVDGVVRTGTWDIGADEIFVAPVSIYRSLQPFRPGAIDSATAGSRTLTIADSTATFSGAVPSDVGLGDVFYYDANNNGTRENLAFVSRRVSSTVFIVYDSLGTTTNLNAVTADDAWKTYRAYTTLANVSAGTENVNLPNFDGSGQYNLVSNNWIFNVVCYAGVDSNSATISGWTTSRGNLFKVYTPTCPNQVGTSQRHNGVRTVSAYLTKTRSLVGGDAVHFGASSPRGPLHVFVDGLQVEQPFLLSQDGIEMSDASCQAFLFVANCLVIGSNSVSTQSSHSGIRKASSASNGLYYALNNIVYDWRSTGTTTEAGIDYPSAGGIGYFLNNTTYNNNIGINRAVAGSGVFVKNNTSNSDADGFSGGFQAESDYNISELAGDAPGSNSKQSTAVTFVGEGSTPRNLHLDSGDTAAKNFGFDLMTVEAGYEFRLLHVAAFLQRDLDFEDRGYLTTDNGADEQGASESACSTSGGPRRRRAVVISQ